MGKCGAKVLSILRRHADQYGRCELPIMSLLKEIGIKQAFIGLYQLEKEHKIVNLSNEDEPVYYLRDIIKNSNMNLNMVQGGML